MGQLQISQTPMKLNFSYPMGRQTIRQQKPELNISAQKASLSIRSNPIRVIIDQTPCFESMNRYNPVRFSQKTAAEAKDVVMETIYMIGDDAKAITDTKGGAFVDVCKRKMAEYSLDLTTAFIPARPIIDWVGGRPTEATEINYAPYKLDFNWNVNPRPQINYERGQFNLSVAQYNKVEIAYNHTREL